MIRKPILRWVLVALWAATPSWAAEGAEALRSIRALELDPERCYRVRDVFLQREDVKLYFTDGHLIFAKPVLGRTVAALFLATGQTDVGEVLVIPPIPAERQSIARFLDESILSEQFRNAMLFFTDDTQQALEEAIARASVGKPDRAEGERIAARWSVVLRNLIEGSSFRVLLDLHSGREPRHGFFAAVIRGGKLGRFDVVVDPLIPEQVVIGQLVRSGSRSYYEVWTRFPARSYRNGVAEPPPEAAQLDAYRIEAALGPDLHMRVRASADLHPAVPGARAIGFELSDRLEVTSLRIDGQDVEFLQEGRTSQADRSQRADSTVVAMVGGRLTAGGVHRVEFEYRGKVVSDAGQGVYFVDNRRNWYPRTGTGKARYELGFRYPRSLDLVATGSLLEQRVEGGLRISRFDSGKPIRTAAFNIGDYASTRREVNGFGIEVKATRSVEARLQPRRMPVVIPPPAIPGRRRGRSGAQVVVVPPPPVDPSTEIERIADDSAQAFAYFMRRFGEPAMPNTVISPVPAGFGQGFPGLVYASTLSYFERGDQLLQGLPPSARRFYADLMRPHEIAHQWWGNVVSSRLDRDAWIMEALATYSSLLWLEERQGVAERNRVLAEFRSNLLRKVDGETVESAGPLILGRRLRTADLPEAYRVIVYEKGAWVIHMLRGILGDESFFAMLAELVVRYGEEAVSTDMFRALAAEFVPAGHHDPGLRDFFDQWVRGTGIPQLSVDWRQESGEGRFRFSARLQQSGVDEYFPVSVPIEVHTLPGRSLVKRVLSGTGDEAGFSVVLRNAATRVVVDPEGWLLADAR